MTKHEYKGCILHHITDFFASVLIFICALKQTCDFVHLAAWPSFHFRGSLCFATALKGLSHQIFLCYAQDDQYTMKKAPQKSPAIASLKRQYVARYFDQGNIFQILINSTPKIFKIRVGDITEGRKNLARIYFTYGFKKLT